MKVLFQGEEYADLSDLIEDLHVRFGYELKDNVIELLEISDIKFRRASSEFSLMDYMTDILIHFCEKNSLQFASASEIDYETEEQREWLSRFRGIWHQVEDRYCERRWGK